MGSYVPNTREEQKAMLAEIGFSSMEDLFIHIPDEVKVKGALDLPEGMSELEVRRRMQQMAAKNTVFPTIFRGAGAYRHFIPAIVKSVTSKENLMTAYTPYQAEISQGILQSIYEYQTMICDLTGLDASNASERQPRRKGSPCAGNGSGRKPLCRQRHHRMYWRRSGPIASATRWNWK